MARRVWSKGVALGAGLFVATALVGQQPAVAAEPQLSGTAAATNINVLNGTVASGPTSWSELSAGSVDESVANRLADVEVGGVLRASVLSTEVSRSAADSGKRIVSTANAAGVKLLGGAIKVDAITTTSSVTLADGVASYAGDTKLVGLTVGGKTLPVRVAPNTRITLPGLATVVINKVAGRTTSDAAATVASAGLEITLLKAVNSAPAGAIIQVTPTTATVAQIDPTEGPLLGGGGYALAARAHVGSSVKAVVGPVALQSLPPGGTARRELARSTAGVRLVPLAVASALGTTVLGSRQSDHSSGTVTAHVARLNLLGGAIVADAVTAEATASRDSGADRAIASGSSQLVGLRIGGRAIPASVPPNTVIGLPNLATVTLNEQTTTADGVQVRAVHVVVTAGPLVGVSLDVATANVTVGR